MFKGREGAIVAYTEYVQGEGGGGNSSNYTEYVQGEGGQ